ncbi:MAG: sugar ABC transporter ATP-binding protein [Bacillota bacterium]|jgi:ABC-type sugar transport system ATPase subunit|nr:sugar ABC transporter ATP-binding protein [Bacillota bacterium]
MPEPKSILLTISNVSKHFPGTLALDNVNLDVYEGEIHAICGENGAGKSTLMKILSGVYPYGSYQGEIYFGGQEVRFATIKSSERLGIRIIYQELTLVPQMTVADNIMLGAEPNKYGVIDQNQLYRDTEELLKSYNLDIPYNARVGSLGIGKQQMVEIAKALSGKARLLILDEPTSALTIDETNVLMHILRDLKRRGVTCIYISHKLEEVFAIADRITVLRDGQVVGTHAASDLDQNRVISLMVGRELTNQYPTRTKKIGDITFQVKEWTVARPGESTPVVKDISFDLRQGEILGISGLMGSGRTELVQSIFGEYGRRLSGELLLGGEPIEIRSSQDAIHHGLALLTEDRKGTSLVLKHSVLTNATLPSLPDLVNWSIIDSNKELAVAYHYQEKLQIKTPTIHALVNSLSGGNQQKVALAKWLMTEPKILIMDEPTRGIDVGTKYEVYRLMNDLTEQGVSIIMVSSELPEILGMSDRILVMYEGTVAGIVENQDVSGETIMRLATGGA